MKERGLGTPATRAVIIEKLIAEEYVLRNGRELQPTPKAFSLVTLLRGLEIPELTSPELTGEWEYKLKEMEHGKLSRAAVHARHRRHDASTSWSGRRRTKATPCRATTSTLDDAVPRMRRRHQGELQEVPVPELRLRAVAHPVGPPVRARGDRRAHSASARSVRCRVSAAGSGNRSPRTSSSRPSSRSSSISASSRATATGSPSISRIRSRWAPARNAVRVSSRTAWPISARTRRRVRAPATSAPARSSCSGRSSPSR